MRRSWGGAPQASAAGSITLTPPADGKLFDDVNNLRYTYALALPPNNLWNVRVSLTRPDGIVQQIADFLSDDYNPVAGTSALRLSPDGTTGAGIYPMTANLEWRESTGVYHDEPPVTAQFKVLRLATRTTMAVSTKRPRFGGTVVFKTKTLLREASAGLATTPWTGTPGSAGAAGW